MRRYLHFITQPYSLSVIKPLAELIEKEGWGENLVFIAPKVRQYYDLRFPYCTTLREALTYQPEVVFVPGNVVYPRLPGLKVQIFHGICEEKGGHYKITGFFDLYCTSGPLITTKFQKLAARHGYFQVVETGWPKIDALLAPFERTQLLERLAIPPSHKIILYAPTFSPRFNSSDKILPVIEDLPRFNETWIIKFHDLMQLPYRQLFHRLPGQHFRIYEHYDNIPLLQLADVLISDTSSIVYEFILLDKPVITLGAKVRLEKGINLQDATQLRASLDRVLTNPAEYQAGRAKVIAEIHPYRDGQNARRVLEAVETKLKSGIRFALKPKPLNLYRKWRVYRQMKNWL